MNRNLAWGAGALLAIAAFVGISTQTPKSSGTGTPGAAETKKTIPPQGHGRVLDSGVCADPAKILQEFLLASEEDVAAPDSCYPQSVLQDPAARNSLAASRQRLKERASGLSFMIATLPDPLHTHLSLLFDRKIEAIQQAAQDAGYDYDSSWLPWETQEHTFATLSDEDTIDSRKDAREEQPGLLLFRRRSDKLRNPLLTAEQPFQEGLAIFIVGEEATRGIHRRQFQNAARWVALLQPDIDSSSPIAILGPTFSGSFPSLAELLADSEVRNSLHKVVSQPDHQLRIYSGSVSGTEAVEAFGTLSATDPNLKGWNIHFHSFIESDDTLLRDYCDYLNQKNLHAERVALISEDETAYGMQTVSHLPESDAHTPCPRAVRLFYPRDTSALRAAYQAQSIFSSPTSEQSADTQRRTLSTDLADPAGEAHDTVRSYGGNQTPLAQEAQLLGIVGVLRDHRSEYLIIRSSNTLDQLFLANFFRRAYPQGRIVLRGVDTLFLRERGSTGISGVMTLSTYPLIPWDWRDWLNPSLNPTHRIFGDETVEGTYIATRFLVQESFKEEKHLPTPLGDDLPACSTKDPGQCFLPINLYPGFLIPDYKAPFWTVPQHCETDYEEKSKGGGGRTTAEGDETCKPYFRPATWISVLGRGNFYPLAAFTKAVSDPSQETKHTEEPHPAVVAAPSNKPTDLFDSTVNMFSFPLSMKICLLCILAFGAFEVWCCWCASFTAKPAFRAHFAATSHWFPYDSWRHPTLITIAGTLIAYIALLSAWGCGAFCQNSLSLVHRVWLWIFLFFAMAASLGSILANQQAVHRLETFTPARPSLRSYFTLDWKSKSVRWSIAGFAAAIAIYVFSVIYPFESQPAIDFENRLPTYWRAMNLNSGVSPIVPFLILFAGLYVWFWYSLHGLALFGIERPRLPSEDSLLLKDEGGLILRDDKGNPLPNLRMFSQEKAQGTEEAALPMEKYTFGVAAVVFLVFFFVAYATAADIPLRSLGAPVYAKIFCIVLDVCISWMLAETWQLWRVWRKLKQLLSFLDRIALRRTMSTLQGFSWGNVWRMSGNVLDVRYKLLSRQIETLNHLKASFEKFEKCGPDPGQRDDGPAIAACHDEIKNALGAITSFAPAYSSNYDKNDFADFSCLQTFQKAIAALVGRLLTDVLIPSWRAETKSLMREEAKNSNGGQADSKPAHSRIPEYIRNAEELVCITYLGFVQNILGRIRTMSLGIVWLFVAITLSVSMYPFDPRPTLNKTLVFLFLAVGAIISSVYAEIHRDSTLSHVTNTTPGELGMEFWFKIIGFGVGPLIGLVAYVFPGLTDFLFSWLEPGMASLK